MPRIKRNAIIVGCGQFGAAVAGNLSSRGYGVTVIDKDEEAFHRLDGEYGGFTTTGDGGNASVLRSAGITGADILLATTDDDDTNILIAEIASRIYGVEHVYARLNDMHKAELFDGYNIEAICPLQLCLSQFELLSGVPMERIHP
ncbi:MAG: NAD-binding protein [Actinomycetota bacterium]|nr:NAD-binding protein [Actinomycetota bacterium]